MKQQMLKERVELLAIGEALGYPRLGLKAPSGRKWAVRAGQPSWERFCSVGHTTRIVTVLKNARILRDNGAIPYNPRVEITGNMTVSNSPFAPPPVIPTTREELLADLLDDIGPIPFDDVVEP